MSTKEAGELDRFAEASIAQGSKSFAAAARLFDGATRRDVMRLYSWCRHCDDVVDGQEGGQGHVASPEPPEARIAGLRRDTARALAGEANGLPLSFRALGAVARRHAMPASLFEEHLNGFALDVEGRRYETLDELLTYCWHVAGVVGVMMARVMGARDEAVLDRAADLGLAFQLTNIARDVVADAGRGASTCRSPGCAKKGFRRTISSTRPRRRPSPGCAPGSSRPPSPITPRPASASTICPAARPGPSRRPRSCIAVSG